MKRIMKIAALALVITLGTSWRNNIAAQQPYEPPYDQDDEVSYQTFYDELSPHGRWVETPEYGYAWIPNAEPDFRPYSTNGHWVYTDDYEWMWVSDYEWGWAPFHYGRWDQDPYYGWMWIPGYEWSPAWVAWRDGGDYYGWAPLRPGINISVNFSIGSYAPPYDYWCFTPRRYITSRNIYSYCVPRRQNITIINQTTIINNYNYRGNVWRTGPRRVDVEIYAGRVTPVRFRSASRPGRTVFSRNEVNIYRPSIRRDNGRQIAPRNFERYDRNNARVRSNGNNNRVERNGNNGGSIDMRRRQFEERTRGAQNNNQGNNGRVFRQQGQQPNSNNNDGSIDRRRRQFEERTREANPNQGNNERRVFRQQGQGQQPNNNNGGSVDMRRRQFEERTRGAQNNSQGNNERVFRQQQQRQSMPDNNNRQVERRPMERNNSPVVREQRQMRTDDGGGNRQFERRSGGNENNGGGNGGGRGRRGRDN